MATRYERMLLILSILFLFTSFSFLLRPPIERLTSLAGEVLDESGPVSGATVRFKGSSRFVLTDARGRFSLTVIRGSSAAVTAWKEGYVIAGREADRQPLALMLTRLPREDDENYAWVDPAPDVSAKHNCANCHAEIYREWSASGHARSATGSYFRNLYEGSDATGKPHTGWGLLTQRPESSAVCAACHAPSVASFVEPPGSDLREVRGVAAHGVHCDLCHKIVDTDRKNIGLTHGRFGLTLLRPSKGQLFFGLLDDVDRGEDGFAPIYRESRYCASCHEGTVLGVHVYSTYTEWLASPARREGKQCQTCHMTPTGKMTNMAPGKGGIARDPLTLASHRFPGGEEEMLKRCLKTAVTLSSEPKGVKATVTVRADDAGHRVPTGFVDRNLVLIVESLGVDGMSLPAREGPMLPSAAGNEWSGKPGRLYAKLLKDAEGRSPMPFWMGPLEVEDTRLFPGQTDTATFLFPAATTRVRVRLLYRRFWQGTAEVKGWTEHEVSIMDEVFEALTGERMMGLGR